MSMTVKKALASIMTGVALCGLVYSQDAGAQMAVGSAAQDQSQNQNQNQVIEQITFDNLSHFNFDDYSDGRSFAAPRPPSMVLPSYHAVIGEGGSSANCLVLLPRGTSVSAGLQVVGTGGSGGVAHSETRYKLVNGCRRDETNNNLARLGFDFNNTFLQATALRSMTFEFKPLDNAAKIVTMNFNNFVARGIDPDTQPLGNLMYSVEEQEEFRRAWTSSDVRHARYQSTVGSLLGLYGKKPSDP